MGDSGWAHFEINGTEEDNEYTRALVDGIYDTLDYGSWAGEFSASGEAVYDPESNSFTGTDFYGEDTNDELNVDFTIRVPKKFWFSTLGIEIERDYDSSTNLAASFLVRNGFLSQEHREFCSNLEKSLAVEFDNLFDNLFDNYKSDDSYEFRSCYDNWILERENAIEDGDDLVFKITQVDIGFITNEEKLIVLELNEDTANSIDDILNNEQYEN